MPWRALHNLVLILASALALVPRASRAALDPTTFLNATNERLAEIGALVGLGFDLHAYEGVRPYSNLLGLDIGASITAITVPGDAVKALTDLGIPNVPHYLPAPKINIQKGFGERLLVGAEFIPNIRVEGSTLQVYGFDAQWTLIDRPRLPPVSIRGQYNYSDLAFVRTSTFGADAVVGWNMLLVDVYGGGGYRFVKASIHNPTPTVPQAQGVNFDPTVDAGHFFVGAVVRAGFVRITTEANFTTRGVNTYGTKLSFYF